MVSQMASANIKFNKYDIRELYFGTFHFNVNIVLLLWRKKNNTDFLQTTFLKKESKNLMVTIKEWLKIISL